MKITTIDSWTANMKYIASVLALVFVALPAQAGVNLLVPWNPNYAQNYGALWYATGSLTQAYSQIGNHEAGIYETIVTTSFTWTGTVDDCCDGQANPGKTIQVEASMVTVTFECVGYYKLVEWFDRGSYIISRPRAVAEWDRVYNDTWGHELKHCDYAMASFSQVTLQPFFDAAFYTINTPCDIDPTKKNAIQYAESAIAAAISAAKSNSAAYEQANDFTHNVWPYTTINVSEDRP